MNWWNYKNPDRIKIIWRIRWKFWRICFELTSIIGTTFLFLSICYQLTAFVRQPTQTRRWGSRRQPHGACQRLSEHQEEVLHHHYRLAVKCSRLQRPVLQLFESGRFRAAGFLHRCRCRGIRKLPPNFNLSCFELIFSSKCHYLVLRSPLI